MTTTKLVSVKVPLKIFRALPDAHKGRSRFIISALEEKISQCRGRRMAALLEKGRAEREPLLDAEGIAAELAGRKGKFH